MSIEKNLNVVKTSTIRSSASSTPAMETVPIDAKWTFTTRRVNRSDAAGLSSNFVGAVAGDLILVQTTAIGQHKNVQLAEGRNSQNFVGGYVVAAVGDRYAPDQFEGSAEIVEDECYIVAGGGIVGRVTVANDKMQKATKVLPIGLLTDAEGEVLNLASYAVTPQWEERADEVTVIGVFGTAMNSGKTTAASSLALGLKRSGYNVAGIKATGTGAFGDFNAFRDLGIPIRDFVDAGMGTTYRMPHERVEHGFETLVHKAAGEGADVIVVEFADGVFQTEAAQMLRRGKIGKRLDGVMFAAYDSAGAIAGNTELSSLGLAPMVISGCVSCSPLAIRETNNCTGVIVATRDELRDPDYAKELVQKNVNVAAARTLAA